MHTTSTSSSVAEYCLAVQRSEVQIDPRYQRSPKVWPAAARSYLIETILLGYPIPKLAVHLVTERATRKTKRFVVDGQQRTMALTDFFNGKLRLAKTIETTEAAGCVYGELPPELQDAFLAYTLHFDQFDATTDAEIRDYFRRINAFTTPLNPEEKRHARFQGAMKWFVHTLTQRNSPTLVRLKAVTETGAARMADTKLIAEVVNALKYGVTTTKAPDLDRLYKSADDDPTVPFDGQQEMADAVNAAFDQIVGWPELVPTLLVRTHVFYSLLLALIAVQKRWATLVALTDSTAGISAAAVENLLTLADVLENPDNAGVYKPFLQASNEKTNVKAQREERIRWLARAIQGQLPPNAAV